jgi:DNA (cytosine-5)-methyltransferase 1
MKIYAVDIMCGIGGATRGFLDAGIQVVKGIDIDESCRKTYEENNKPAKFLKRNVVDLTANEILKGVERQKTDKLVIIACAPCQPFSRAGVRDPKDGRTRLILAINRLITDIKPDFVFVENAPGFQRFYPELYKEFLKPYQKLRYHYRFEIVNLREYGVPQNRRRYLFIASRDCEIDLPERTHGKGLLPYVTVGDKIKKYPPLKPGEENTDVSNHVCYNLSRIMLERLHHTPKDGGSRSAWPRHLVLQCHRKTGGHSDVYGRMCWNKPGPTLTCKCINVSNGRFAHPEQDRGISIREAAALQTFNDDFIFYEPKSIAAKHIGNAVPPSVAFLSANTIIETAQNNTRQIPMQSSRARDTHGQALNLRPVPFVHA